MTKLLIFLALIALPISTSMAATDDCFFKFSYTPMAMLDNAIPFKCETVAMKTAYNPDLTENSNFDDLHKEIETLESGKVLCSTICKNTDITDYTKSSISAIDYLKEKWCLTKADVPVKISEETILSKKNLKLKSEVIIHRLNAKAPKKP
ncbi:MAG: hypothetical protein WCQ53_06310 [bacterium]